MSPRAGHRLERLGTATCILIVAATAVGVYKLLRPLPTWQPPEINRQAPEKPKDADPRKPALSELAVIWQRDLRQPLFDPQPQSPPAPPPERPVAIELLGTVVEARQRYGLFRLSDRRTVIRPVGGDVEGYSVVGIERGRAQLRRGAREVELKVPWYDQIAEERTGDGS